MVMSSQEEIRELIEKYISHIRLERVIVKPTAIPQMGKIIPKIGKLTSPIGN